MSNDVDKWLQEMLEISDATGGMTDKQLRIVEAAMDIFSEKGFASTSTSEIAQRAGVAEGTIFRHYKTKKDLLLAIVAPAMGKLIAPFVLKDFNKVLETPYERYEDFLRAVIRNRMEFAKNNMAPIRILFQEVAFHPELKEAFKKIVAKQVFERFHRTVSHFQQSGQIIEAPPNAVIRFTASAVIGFLATKFILLPEIDWDDDKEIELLIDMIMNGIAHKQ